MVRMGSYGGLFLLELFPDPAATEPLRRRRMAAMLTDAIGIAGAKMIRRVLGISHVEDLEAIADPEARARSAGVAGVTAPPRAVG